MRGIATAMSLCVVSLAAAASADTLVAGVRPCTAIGSWLYDRCPFCVTVCDPNQSPLFSVDTTRRRWSRA
jgi:hypothetical protein